MNKIKLVNNEILVNELDENIVFTNGKLNNLLDVDNFVFEIINDTKLMIEYENKAEVKLDIIFKINPNVKLELIELKKGFKCKTQYKFYLQENSYMRINKFYDLMGCKELDLIYLDGENSKVDYYFKTISKEKEQYDLMIYHNKSNTSSNINNSGVNIKNGKLIFNVSSFVPKNSINCIVDQKGRIVNLVDELCQINPNLLIDENDVEANHSAIISKFSDEVMFYLQSRGIDKLQALNLLIKGFLLENIDDKEKIEKIIDKYWG